MALAAADTTNWTSLVERAANSRTARQQAIRRDPFSQYLSARPADLDDGAGARTRRKTLHDPRTLVDLSDARALEVQPPAVRKARVFSLYAGVQTTAANMALH